MKIFLNSPNENWIVDRFVEEWNDYNTAITSKSIRTSDIVWIISPWTWSKLSKKQLKKKKVLVTIHHIDEKKFDIEDFKNLDKYVNFYHVISKLTESKLEKLTDKKIYYSPFWVSPKKWFTLQNKKIIRKKYNVANDEYLIGSFQRDTEIDLISPKLEKGPDNLLEILLEYKSSKKNLRVILAGNRRDYIVKKLIEHKIKYSYFNMISLKELNELYNILNLYIVSSRVEGGPQAIVECALTKTPLISTNVGIASEILHPDSIFDMNNFTSAIPNIDHAYNKAKKFTIPKGFETFVKIMEEIHES